MLYYSLHRQSPWVDFATATIAGQAPDKGLYFPSQIPHYDHQQWQAWKKDTIANVGFALMKPYVGTSISEDRLYEIVSETLQFPIPLVNIEPGVSSLELFHGPTLAFKDVGARFMSRCLGEFSKHKSEKLTVLVATSGDTGGAVADGFAGVAGVEVVILYPEGKVSKVQEQQLTTAGDNIRAYKVDGSFDDCQALVKQAFADVELRKALFLTSANSINVARWLPQQLYYVLAWQQWQQESLPVVCVPSGNFGNICAGLLAKSSGLPLGHFIAACNSNDTVPRYLSSGKMNALPTIPTLSNAMDVSNPSNFIRIMELLGNSFPEVRSALSGFTISDEDTKATIADVYTRTGYLLDPHGAVAYKGLKEYIAAHPDTDGMILETAHPIKFADVVEPIIGASVPIPKAIEATLQKQGSAESLPNSYEALVSILKR